jgi:hypothetical protein
VRYWDTSAVVPLLLEEARTGEVREMLGQDPEIVTWWGTRTECLSAIWRAVHGGRLPRATATRSEATLTALSNRWFELVATEPIRETAERCLRAHQLRAGDAFHLATALLAAEFRPVTVPFVCYDQRLAHAAQREGFTILGHTGD